ncbi:MAG: SDR family oxidoreductase [Candidatus Sungbacteria bacterium]|nr:SDR family oxidoreductase [Candidatus Sungbacteria bacterium]
MELRRKIVLITGAARVGRLVAETLAKAGMDIALTYRGSKEAAEETAREIAKEFDVKTLTVQGDTTNAEDIARTVETVHRDLGTPAALVYMASLYNTKPILNSADEDWQKFYDVHVKGAVRLVDALEPGMVKQGGGRVVLFADVAALKPYSERGWESYLPSKGAVIALTRYLARTRAPHILVNAIAPGPIEPPAGMSQKEIEKATKDTLLKRWIGAGEIAKTVQFLLETDSITGQCLAVDGGRTLL